MTVEQIQADVRKMKRFICERIPPDGPTRIVIEPGWVDLTAFWEDDGDCELHIESNGPYAIGLREVYEHFRSLEMTGWEKECELANEFNRWRLHQLEREDRAMGFELNHVPQATLEMDQRQSAISLLSALPDLAAIAKSLERIADAVDPPPADKVDTTYVAKKLGIGIPRVSQMASAGEIPANCIVAGTGHGKLWKFHRSRIDQWIESR